MSRCREIYAGATLDEGLFQYMCMLDSRERLRSVLVQTYFYPDIQHRVIEQGFVNLAFYGYAKTLVGQTAEQIDLFGKAPEEKKKRIGDGRQQHGFPLGHNILRREGSP